MLMDTVCCVTSTDVKDLHLQGHALLTRHLGSSLPCPYTDYDAGWEQWYAAAYNLPKGQTIKQKFGASFGAASRRSFFRSVEAAEAQSPLPLLPTVDPHRGGAIL